MLYENGIEMEKEMQRLKDLILDYMDEYNQITVDINNIERQIGLYEHGNLEKRPETWYIKARKALNIKKDQRLVTEKKLAGYRQEFKIANAKARRTRQAKECRLYEEKLEELMDPESFQQFSEEIRAKLEATDER